MLGLLSMLDVERPEPRGQRAPVGRFMSAIFSAPLAVVDGLGGAVQSLIPASGPDPVLAGSSGADPLAALVRDMQRETPATPAPRPVARSGPPEPEGSLAVPSFAMTRALRMKPEDDEAEPAPAYAPPTPRM